MLKKHERTVLTLDLPEHHLKAGDVGTVVFIYGDHEAYELEFFALNGQTLDVVTVDADQVRAVTSTEVLHAREIA